VDLVSRVCDVFVCMMATSPPPRSINVCMQEVSLYLDFVCAMCDDVCRDVTPQPQRYAGTPWGEGCVSKRLCAVFWF